MRIVLHKKFTRRFEKLPPDLKEKTKSILRKFESNPFDPLLKNHTLTGKFLGQRAFSVTGNVRIVFEEYNHYVAVLMLDIGTHNQVYE